MYTYLYKYTHTYIYIYPPDPINDPFSLSDWQMSGNYCTHRSVQVLKIWCRGSDAPGSDPTHKIMRYWRDYSTMMSCRFPPDQYDQAEMFCTTSVPAPKGHIGGAGPQIFSHDS